MLLVVNGDDAGAHARSDQGILTACQKGMLKSASVLVNGPNARQFVSEANDEEMGLGLHFNISEGFPTGGPYRTLTDKDGAFFTPKKKAWDLASKGEFDPAEVAMEAKAQFEAFNNLGALPDHIDSHNHVHIFADVLEGIKMALGQVPNLFIRLPFEPECAKDRLPFFPKGWLTKEEMIFIIKDTQWNFSDRFIGYMFTCDQTMFSISHLNKNLAGITEWMVHVSSRPGTEFTMDKRRDSELEFLLNSKTFEYITNWGYKIGRFGDLI